MGQVFPGAELLKSFLASAALLLALAPRHASADELARTTVQLGGERYRVEVAADDRSRMRGLMFRDSLGADEGMLFVFAHEQPLAFWMKNTRIALDILYFDQQLRLVSVAEAQPCRSAYCPPYPSERPARFVLELNAGEARRLGLVAGARLTIEDDGGATATLD